MEEISEYGWCQLRGPYLGGKRRQGQSNCEGNECSSCGWCEKVKKQRAAEKLQKLPNKLWAYVTKKGAKQ